MYFLKNSMAMVTDVQFKVDEDRLKTLLEDFFLILTETEKQVVTKRFSLDDKPKQTLEVIGKHFDVTRERIRQIENTALKKLQRNIMTSHLRKISDVARKVLQENGGMMTRDVLISKALKVLHVDSQYSANVLRFALRLDEKISEVKRATNFHPFYHFSDISLSRIQAGYKIMRKTLQAKKQVMSFAAIFKESSAELAPLGKQNIEAIAQITPKILEVEPGIVGLSRWRNINPKSIKDKAILIFEKEKKPLHFIELANQISTFGDVKKTVTIQAVHNDLIRYEEFVLVGRGMYALSKWGVPAGTVMDIIAKVLKEKGPLSRKEIIASVKALRDVKENTISLNLQKGDAFVRVGRAVYDFDESKWEAPKSGRGRAYLKDKNEA